MVKKISIVMYLSVVLTIFLLSIYSCKKDRYPVLTTSEINDITAITAISGGNISSEGKEEVISRGVCWSTSQNPTINDQHTIDGSGVGDFTSKIEGLAPNTTYYLRAYATNSAGTGYGNSVSFTTLPEFSHSGTVSDIDGNVYNTVAIGSQIWMVENLKTTKYRDGTSIPNITDNNVWSNLTTSAYCNYNNNDSIAAIYGRLYNWYAVIDSRNIAPNGWHVPTDADWTILINYLGGEGVAGGKLKEADTIHWVSPNAGATNVSGFTALGGGFRSQGGGPFILLRAYGVWWSSSEDNSIYAWHQLIDSGSGLAQRMSSLKISGYSIRCIKD